MMADPSVAAMSEAQWLFEYEAMRLREEEELEMWTNLLGLKLPGRPVGSPFLPASLVMGNPRLLEQWLKPTAAEALAEDEFDALSERIAAGEGDILPVGKGDLPGEAELRAAFRAGRAGVAPAAPGVAPAAPVVSDAEAAERTATDPDAPPGWLAPVEI